MGLIEQAAKRLEELKRAGIDVPAGKQASLSGREEKVATSSTVEKVVAAAEPKRVFREALRGEAASEAVVPPAGRSDPRRSRHVELDLQTLAAAGYVTPTAPRSQLADELRVIKRPLLANVQGKGAAPVNMANRIMVTSAMPGEGKTFLAINLAMSLAMELDSTVLLVDADVARPAIPSRLGFAQEQGLLDLLTHKGLDVADVILRTSVERLSILPAGTPHSRATELLASEGMNRLVEELTGRYQERILVFDAPPLLPSTESRVLATHMGQVIVVVEADQTTQGDVTQALATLEGCPIVMTVLNKVTRSRLGSYYGYQGHYGYAS